MPAINPDHLLEQADKLMAAPAAGAPRQADLRRAMSNAYYALFHAILTQAADDLMGYAHRQTVRYALVYRSVDHKVLRNVCDAIVKSTVPAKYVAYVPPGGFGADILAVAAAVSDLQEKRHSADYDPLLRVLRSDAILTVSTARAALVAFNGANRTRRKAFLALVVFPPR